MIFITFCLSVFLIFYLNYKKKRISPLNPDKYLISPIDGYVSGIQTINVDDVLFIEITLNFSLFSDRNLFAPIRGEVIIKESSKERLILSVSKNKKNIIEMETKKNIRDLQNNVIEVSHHSNEKLSNFNIFSSSFMSLYEKESWIPSMNYGWMFYGNQIKILLHASNEIVVANEQSVIGGESILAILKKSDTLE